MNPFMEENSITNKQTLNENDLRYFTGDLTRFRHALNRSVIYTPGVQHVAEKGDAYWLIDAIASYLTARYLKPIIAEDSRVAAIQFWELTVTKDNSAVLEARADAGGQPFVRQEIEFTDFPLGSIRIWAGFDGRLRTHHLSWEH